MTERRIGFIGSGQMARALARGFVSAQLVDGAQISASDKIAASAELFASEVAGARIADDNLATLGQSDILFIAVKPQHVDDVTCELNGQLGADKLVISIVAGITLKSLSQGLGTDRLVRVMPNTPCLVGQGASGFALADGATDADAALVGQLLSAVGTAVRVDEQLLDAVTGLSGSGPAYTFTVIEALSDGGVRMGLPRDVATTLAVQTVLGSAALVNATGDHPAVLRDRVTSPGGTTIAGLQAMEQHGVRAALIDAVEAATQRAKELGQES